MIGPPGCMGGADLGKVEIQNGWISPWKPLEKINKL